MEAFGNSASKTITYKIIRFLVSFRKRLLIFVDLLTNWNAIRTMNSESTPMVKTERNIRE